MELIKNYETILIILLFLGIVRTIIKHEFKKFEVINQTAQDTSIITEVLEDIKVELVDSKLREDGLEEIIEESSRVLERSREMIKTSKPLLRDLELRYLREDMQQKQEDSITPSKSNTFKEMK